MPSEEADKREEYTRRAPCVLLADEHAFLPGLLCSCGAVTCLAVEMGDSSEAGQERHQPPSKSKVVVLREGAITCEHPAFARNTCGIRKVVISSLSLSHKHVWREKGEGESIEKNVKIPFFFSFFTLRENINTVK
jgi:hypothetical protein